MPHPTRFSKNSTRLATLFICCACPKKLRFGLKMSYAIPEENLREAACIGDLETVQNLIRQNVNVNCKHSINGWTPLHWASKRGHEQIVKFLLAHGADSTITNHKGESPVTVCSNTTILTMMGSHEISSKNAHSELKFTPNYITNPPLNGHIDLNIKHRPRLDLCSTKIEHIPSNDNLVLRVRIAGLDDPDYIEIEVPHKNLTYSNLLHICCQELCVKESQIERIRKLPNIRLRNDNDVKRLENLQYLEIVIHSNNKENKLNPYPLISTCKNQTILY